MVHGPRPKMCKPTPIVTSPTKNSNPNLPNCFLNRNSKTSLFNRGFEQLSSSIGRQVMTGQIRATIVTLRFVKMKYTTIMICNMLLPSKLAV